MLLLDVHVLGWFAILGGMAIVRKRILVGLGAALVVGSWAAYRYGLGEYVADKTTWLSGDDMGLVCAAGMMWGAALIVAAGFLAMKQWWSGGGGWLR